MIITFSGVDCAGKSTQIDLLKQYFISVGKSCTVFWYRPGYSNEMQAVKRLVRPLFDSAHHIKQALDKWRRPASSEASEPTAQSDNKRSVPAPLWLSTAIVDTTIQWGLKLRYLAHKYDVVICDRYVHDATLDIMLKYPQYTWTESFFQRMAKVLPSPSFSFLLWIPADEMIRRAEIKAEPFPDDAHTRQLRYRAYEFIADQDVFRVIDASGTIEETHHRILSEIKGNQQPR